VVSIKNAPQELLGWVNDWVAQPKYVYRHKWRLHDLVFWDNRRVMHHATPYPESQRRHMHRTTIKGSAPYLEKSPGGSLPSDGPFSSTMLPSGSVR
jgi:alpha-ketoglutarate-dependent taurine dioxygenase